MAVNKLKAPRNIHIDFSPSPRQYELWKLLQPNYCPHCGAEIEQVLVGFDNNIDPLTPDCWGAIADYDPYRNPWMV